MTTKNADMPAIPQSGMETICGDLNDSSDWGGSGLTKREHFAAMAMDSVQAFILAQPDSKAYSKDQFAAMCKSRADALLAELEKTNGES